MCKCANSSFEVRDNQLYGEYDGDFHRYPREDYSFCPICGEYIQPEQNDQEETKWNPTNSAL